MICHFYCHYLFLVPCLTFSQFIRLKTSFTHRRPSMAWNVLLHAHVDSTSIKRQRLINTLIEISLQWHGLLLCKGFATGKGSWEKIPEHCVFILCSCGLWQQPKSTAYSFYVFLILILFALNVCQLLH